jgi:hypothetical protein
MGFMTAQGTFETAGWVAEPAYDERDGVSLARVSLGKTFRGDLEGTSTVWMIVAASEHEESRSYVAMERVSGVLEGREGGFVLQHSAVSDRGDDSLTCSVVPGSGTGGLAGLRGALRIVVAPDGGHSYAFEYTLEG